jgi:hypothetical protein
MEKTEGHQNFKTIDEGQLGDKKLKRDSVMIKHVLRKGKREK